ncbi:LacI family transcriptional regulator [Sphingobium sp. 22B]|uniref:LacI family DNA-binding transcriptional regulator n=1 Tax=unclassified Sphingobium TaxID=2611147 RepID=UPI0007865269|nr:MULTISPECIES: LacI family DNA-binding transcriptional regulator [unclassified Sphingobium]KXU29493.1 LacI family transcriptional regulator [Sphingobium sp. AM]KYC30055.1 LacI family transcriptional regulator [Sphingobium sp. 22B]OAP29671.1 LacI family transcriptional regulator [Sphingobium sp. 20006FA]
MAVNEKPTSFDIATLAGVSQPTVSRALRGDRTVSEATRKRIEAIARQLNYTVDKNASSLRRGKSNTLALLFFEDLLPDESYINPFFLSMLGPILQTCAKRGYDLLTSFQQLSTDWHVDYEDSRKADGIILLGYGDYESYRARLEQLVAQGTHFVRWGSVDPNALGMTIGCDNRRGGREAGQHLIERGRRTIAFLGDASSRYPEFRDRYAGLTEAMGKAGLPVDIGLHVDALSTEQSGHEAASRLIARGLPFDAIFAGSDLIAIGAMRALDEAGMRVPQDVALIGFDDIPAASLTRPPLTTVAQDYLRAGEVLVDALIGQIDRKPVEPTLLAPRLVTRMTA